MMKGNKLIDSQALNSITIPAYADFEMEGAQRLAEPHPFVGEVSLKVLVKLESR